MKKHRKQKVFYICKKRFSTDDDNKKYYKVRDHCYCIGKYKGYLQFKIQNTKKKFLYYLIMVLHMIIIS